MIGTNASGFVHWMGVATLEQNVGFGAHDEEGRTEREAVQSLEIDVAAVHDVERPGLRPDLVEDVDVMHFAVRNADKRGDVAMQVQQGVHLDGALVLAELGPREQRQAQMAIPVGVRYEESSRCCDTGVVSVRFRIDRGRVIITRADYDPDAEYEW